MLFNVLFFVLSICTADSYKILVYNSKYGHSHSNFLGQIADVLVDAGHNVTSLIPIIIRGGADGTTKSKKIYVEQSEALSELNNAMINPIHLFHSNNLNPIAAYSAGVFFTHIFVSQCRATLEQKQLIDRLKSEQYDVMIMENLDVCGTALTELIHPKSFIATSSSAPSGDQFDEFGIQEANSYNPECQMSRLNVHSMWDRFLNVYARFLARLTTHMIRRKIELLFRTKFGPTFPSIAKISSKSAYVFVHTEPLIDYAVPMLSKIIPIGGIGAKESGRLNETWEKILTKREKSVLISFGSVLKSAALPITVRKSILETVKALPNVTFIWKYEEDDEFSKNIASNVDNLHLSKWMPQVEILGIFVPIFGDQPRNAGMMQYNKLGKVFEKADLANSEKLIAVVKEVIEDESYLKNSRKISEMLRKKPFSVKEQIVKYTEFAAKFGPSKALRPQSHDMTFIEYHNLDIICISFIVVVSLIALSVKFARILSNVIILKKKEKTN